MKKIINYTINIIFASIIFPAYYAIGDTVNVTEHLNHPIETCYGVESDDTGSSFSLGDNIGKIMVIGLEIPW